MKLTCDSENADYLGVYTMGNNMLLLEVTELGHRSSVELTDVEKVKALHKYLTEHLEEMGE